MTRMIVPPIIPAATYGTCQYCARLRPMQADGLVALHYLRYGTSQPRRRRRCPGSRQHPRRTQT